jgi:CBS domain-containing protein
MRVQDIMTRGVVTTTPDTDADVAWNLMRQQGIQHLVVQEGKRVVGMLSARDAGGGRGAALRKGRAVAELMSGPVVTVPATATVRQAANVMRGRSIGSLVVLARERPIGIITVSDLLTLLGHGVGRPEQPARPLLQHRVPHRKRHTAAGAW